MSTAMRLIMEGWREFSILESILAEDKKATQMNIDQLADVQAKYAKNPEIQKKIYIALTSDPEVQKLAAFLVKSIESGVESSEEISGDAATDLESAGLQEGLGDFVQAITDAMVLAGAGEMEAALRSVGLGMIADANPKIIGAAVLAITAGASLTGAIDPLDAVKLAGIGGKIAVGGIDSATPEDFADIATSASGLEGGKKAEQ